MKTIAVIGLTFWIHCLVQVVAKGQFHGKVHLGY